MPTELPAPQSLIARIVIIVVYRKLYAAIGKQEMGFRLLHTPPSAVTARIHEENVFGSRPESDYSTNL